MMVTSPGLGDWLLRGMYCLMESWRTSSCVCAVALGYSRMCWASHVCSLTMKGDAIFTIDTPGKGQKCRDARQVIFTELQSSTAPD